jgi:hypothetical protein
MLSLIALSLHAQKLRNNFIIVNTEMLMEYSEHRVKDLTKVSPKTHRAPLMRWRLLKATKDTAGQCLIVAFVALGELA